MPQDRRATAARALQLLFTCVFLLRGAEVFAVATKTLTRFHDPVVISTSALPGALGTSTAGIALYRVRNGYLEAMPYQFDARDRSGNLDVDKPRDFVIADNDELVFMAKDTGDQADGTTLGSAAGLAIEISDPLDGGRGWAYLLPATAATVTSPPAAYVRFDPDRDRATSEFYEIDYANGRNFLTGLRVAPAAGGNGENLLRQTRMLGQPTFSLLFGDMHLSFTERNSIVQVDGTKNGWVRSVRRVQLSVDLGPLFPDLPSGTVHTLHYFSSFSTPTQMSVPWLALKALRDFRFENVIEFSLAAAPQRYWDAANRGGTALTSDSGEKIETNRDHDWWAVSGASGSLLQVFILPEEWTAWGVTRGAVVQRPHAPVGSTAGEFAEAGFTLRDMIQLQHSGSYRLLQSTIILPRPYQPGDEDQVLPMLHAPLQVRVQALETGAARQRDAPTAVSAAP
jgi:hypothetical protein